jgi:pseudaminic acid biosynthesis-associated methylase
MNETAGFWRGRFGEEYSKRNVGLVERNVVFLARALTRISHPIRSVLEFGCGTGQNLEALQLMLADVHVEGVEINDVAADEAATRGVQVYREDALRWRRPEGVHWDLVLSKGFMIHVPPEELPNLYINMFEASERYILIAEYYNPTPVMVPYRGENDRLWKRDFATEFLGRYPSLRVADYGFVWRHDYPWPQDDITWFLLEKR